MPRVMRKASLVLVLILAVACKKEQPVQSYGYDTAGTQPKARGTATATSTVAPRPDAGTVMPTYSTDLLGGGTFDAQAEKGNVVLVNLWATWCGPCRAETPELQALHDQYSGRGFKVVGVSVDEGGENDVKPFLEEFHVTYPIALDPTGRLANILQTDILPTSILVDRVGNIVWRAPGAIQPNDPKLKAAIEKALG
jgi:thiol-disulfide isomerase/thioredoxin